MDAGNQAAAVSVLHQTAANLGGIETNAADFTPSLLELLFGNNRPQVKVPFYCCEIGLTETRGAQLGSLSAEMRRLSVQFVVRLHQSGGRAASPASGILLCHNRREICRPQV